MASVDAGGARLCWGRLLRLLRLWDHIKRPQPPTTTTCHNRQPPPPPRLRDDHARARRLGAALAGLPYVSSLAPVDTNIVIFSVAAGWDAKVGLLGHSRTLLILLTGLLLIGS